MRDLNSLFSSSSIEMEKGQFGDNDKETWRRLRYLLAFLFFILLLIKSSSVNLNFKRGLENRNYKVSTEKRSNTFSFLNFQ